MRTTETEQTVRDTIRTIRDWCTPATHVELYDLRTGKGSRLTIEWAIGKLRVAQAVSAIDNDGELKVYGLDHTGKMRPAYLLHHPGRADLEATA